MKTTKVYSYRADHPSEGLEVIADQISKAHKYYNKLIELHRQFAADREEAKRRYIPGLVEAEAAVGTASAALDDLRDQIRRRNGATRRKTATPEDRAAVAEAGRVLKAAREERKRLRALAAADAAYQAELGQMIIRYQGALVDPDDPDNTRRKGGLFKDARAACGVYFGTYLKVEQAVESAVKLGWRKGPRFRRWTGDGLVAAQIQGGMSLSELLFSADRRVRLQMLPERENPKRPRLAVLWLRVNSDGREPVWAKARVHIPRSLPLPDDARIQWVALTRTQVAARRQHDGTWKPYYRWKVQFTLETAEDKRIVAKEGVCGVDLGWRQMDDGTLRLAYWVGGDGREGELRMPAELLGRFAKTIDWQSRRDVAFNEAKERLTRWA